MIAETDLPCPDAVAGGKPDPRTLALMEPSRAAT